MPDPRSLPDDRPNIGTQPLETEIQALQGEELPADQDAVLDPSEIEGTDELTMSEQEWGIADGELRSGETTDPLIAIEEGEAWIPPSDPPVVPSDDPQGIDVPGSEDPDIGESDMNARVREALRADAATSGLADRLEIAVVGSTAIIRGEVDGIEDSDAILEVVASVEGIDEVREETEFDALG
jgi:hypothetical protein